VLLDAAPSPDGITEAEAEQVVERLETAMALETVLRRVLKSYTRAHGPVKMTDGRLWGPVERHGTVADDPTAAYKLLVQMVGEERASKALSFRRADAQRVLAHACRSGYLQMTPDQAWLAFVGALAERGIQRPYRYTRYCPNEPKRKPKEKPAAAPSPAPAEKPEPQKRGSTRRAAPRKKAASKTRSRKRKPAGDTKE
jgi:hypothetical protein